LSPVFLQLKVHLHERFNFAVFHCDFAACGHC
jgi:hypothetical protein